MGGSDNRDNETWEIRYCWHVCMKETSEVKTHLFQHFFLFFLPACSYSQLLRNWCLTISFIYVFLNCSSWDQGLFGECHSPWNIVDLLWIYGIAGIVQIHSNFISFQPYAVFALVFGRTPFPWEMSRTIGFITKHREQFVLFFSPTHFLCPFFMDHCAFLSLLEMGDGGGVGVGSNVRGFSARQLHRLQDNGAHIHAHAQTNKTYITYEHGVWPQESQFPLKFSSLHICILSGGHLSLTLRAAHTKTITHLGRSGGFPITFSCAFSRAVKWF